MSNILPFPAQENIEVDGSALVDLLLCKWAAGEIEIVEIEMPAELDKFRGSLPFAKVDDE